MPKHRPKQPVQNEQPSRGKTPAAISITEYSHTKACWRIGKIQMSDPYGWHAMTPGEVVAMKNKLTTFEGNTWNEIFVRDARLNHRIPANELRCPTARKWMFAHLPDQPYLWTLRCSNKERIWGILSEDAYQIVFWDPEHRIWDVPKK